MSDVLYGKVAMVTGASRGIGSAVVDGLINEGAKVYALSSSGIIERGDRNSSDDRVMAKKCDVSSFETVERVVKEIVVAEGRIDILVNCAGIQGEICRFTESNPMVWAEAVQVNLFGTYNTCRCVLPVMAKAGSGKIINMSGGGATAPRPNFSSYAVSKVAVVRLTETIAVEFARDGISINAVAPGAINTKMLDDVLAAKDKVDEDVYLAAVKQKEKGGSSLDDAVSLVIFLASRRSDGISGRLISAVHDGWKDLDADRLRSSDWYTLRRVDPYLFSLKR